MKITKVDDVFRYGSIVAGYTFSIDYQHKLDKKLEKFLKAKVFKKKYCFLLINALLSKNLIENQYTYPLKKWIETSKIEWFEITIEKTNKKQFKFVVFPLERKKITKWLYYNPSCLPKHYVGAFNKGILYYY